MTLLHDTVSTYSLFCYVLAPLFSYQAFLSWPSRRQYRGCAYVYSALIYLLFPCLCFQLCWLGWVGRCWEGFDYYILVSWVYSLVTVLLSLAFG